MKKLLAVLLSVLMLVSGFCLTVSAAEGDNLFNDEELVWGHLMGNVTVGAAEGKIYAGSEFTVPVIIENNPGIISIKVAVNYDTDVLELVSAAAGDFGSVDGEVPSLSFGPTDKAPFTINWVDALATENNADNGVLANLTFRVKARPESGSTEISLDFDPDDIFSTEFNPIEFNATAGSVTIESHLPGDVDGDGEVGMLDQGLLQRYLVGWDVEIVEAAADVDGDGEIGMLDQGLLQRYLVGWDVELV